MARLTHALAALVAAAPSAAAATYGLSACYALVAPASFNGTPAAPVTCAATTSRGRDACLLVCGICAQPELAVGFDPSVSASLCADGSVLPDDGSLGPAAAAALLNVSAMQGVYWLDDAGDVEANATEAFTYLVSGLPRRDLAILFREPFTFLEFLTDTVRQALATRAWSAGMGVPWQSFLDNVLPHALLDEKRDVSWRWRARFAQLFAPVVAPAVNITDAMHLLAAAIPAAFPTGVLWSAPAGEAIAVPGPAISWRSSVSPAFISPQQVSSYGGSCTGTAIVLAAAARAVGIPARIAGCGESIVRGDDHKWVEYADYTSAGPFGDEWHTKEGVSAGNAGGPWDSPSGPMLGCLAGVVPGSPIDSLWAASWGSSTYLPTLWSNNSWAATWAFVGGEDRCGAYCTAWGCGVNNTQHWSQAQCAPTAGAA